MNIIWGNEGIIAYNELANYKTSLSANLAELQSKNDSLANDSMKLITQPEEIKIQARELGYFAPDEGVIQLNGYKKPDSGYSMGKLMSHEIISADKGHASTILAVLFGLLYFVSATFLVRYRHK